MNANGRDGPNLVADHISWVGTDYMPISTQESGAMKTLR